MPGVVQFQGWRLKLRELYFGSSATARRFRYGIICFDLLTLVFVIGTSFMPREPWIGMVDVAIGLILAAEYAAHLAAHRAPGRQALAGRVWTRGVGLRAGAQGPNRCPSKPPFLRAHAEAPQHEASKAAH